SFMKTKHTHDPGKMVLTAWQEQIKQAQEQPWLASLLLRQGERILRRFIHFYERLWALPRNARRTIQKKLATTLAGAALLLSLSGTPSVHASSITVDGTTCTLADAITAANTNTATGGCVAGDDAGGHDTIDLQTDVTLGSALPTINSSIVLEGNDFMIDGANSFIVLQANNSGDLTVNNVTITGGSSGFENGAGIHCDGCTLTVNNSTITGNSSNSDGGGIYMSNGSVGAINNSAISGNTANTGGGIQLYAGKYNVTLTINNSTISGNAANIGGGIQLFTINYSDVTLTINNSTITENSSVNGGGGIYVFNTSSSATVNLNNSTITKNSSNDGGGGGISVFNDYGNTTVNLNRTIVSGNTSLITGQEEIEGYDRRNGDGGKIKINGGNYNVIGYSDDARSTNFTPSDTDIIPTGALNTVLNTTLEDNDGPTFTHALVSGSPAIDKVPTTDPNCNADGTSVDQRGGMRANFDDGSGTYCDIGAYEFGSTHTPTAITIQGLTARSEGGAGPAAWGATGILALLTGGWLARVRRSKA
ncbi:MAG: right-handed parallel beta-helix repeat-containing protein, partial [Chloroflexi bacterium]|nr:right-handed parallel beta-helix repeat-containing protein [Chloroflexota bacterium]